MNRVTVLFIATALTLNCHAQDGHWVFFHAETVTHMTCKVEAVQLSQNGAASEEVWQAEATARRNDPSLGDWNATVARFPLGVKGRHAAEKACSRWMDEASKRVKAARP